jgi:protein tyrosine phosphatase (PTP) superfamily phosphohydrolase (DUF442 family)
MPVVVSIIKNMAKRLLLIFLSLAMVFGVGAPGLRAGAPLLRPEVKPLKLRGIENVFALSTNLLSGGTPQGDEGFASLEKLGVKTIITVDGAPPDLKNAHVHGLRYIHLPHGYDGIPAKTQLQLIKAAQTAEGPIYLHCHHGQHRGPVAAAVVCMAEKNWSAAEAEAWLHTAGTGTNFQGLYETVRSFQKPSTNQIGLVPANFPESRKVSDLVDAMVSIDETFDRLKTLRASRQSSAPDNHLLNEATLLREHFREAQRLPDSQRRGAQFIKSLAEAEDQAARFEQTLTSSIEGAAIDRNFTELLNACAACHKAYRDKPIAAKIAPPLRR